MTDRVTKYPRLRKSPRHLKERVLCECPNCEGPLTEKDMESLGVVYTCRSCLNEYTYEQLMNPGSPESPRFKTMNDQTK